jgi:hypothetical protein
MIDNHRNHSRKRIILFVFTEKKSLEQLFVRSVLRHVVVRESKVGSKYLYC